MFGGVHDTEIICIYKLQCAPKVTQASQNNKLTRWCPKQWVAGFLLKSFCNITTHCTQLQRTGQYNYLYNTILNIKKKVVFPFHTIKVYRRSKGIAPLILNLVTRQWCVVTSCLSHFTPRKEPWYPLNRRLMGPQTQSGHFEEGKNILPFPGFEPQTVQPTASHYTGCTIPAPDIMLDNISNLTFRAKIHWTASKQTKHVHKNSNYHAQVYFWYSNSLLQRQYNFLALKREATCSSRMSVPITCWHGIILQLLNSHLHENKSYFQYMLYIHAPCKPQVCSATK